MHRISFLVLLLTAGLACGAERGNAGIFRRRLSSVLDAYQGRDSSVDCICSRQRPIAHVEAGARTATLCHLTYPAYGNRRELRWDASNRKFIDGAEASTWLDRPRRDPWQLPKV